jgi:hypothetical protein
MTWFAHIGHRPLASQVDKHPDDPRRQQLTFHSLKEQEGFSLLIVYLIIIGVGIVWIVLKLIGVL